MHDRNNQFSGYDTIISHNVTAFCQRTAYETKWGDERCIAKNAELN